MRKPVQSESVWSEIRSTDLVDMMPDSEDTTARILVPSIRPVFAREEARTMRSSYHPPAPARRWQRLAMALSAACIVVLAWGAPLVPTLLMLASVATLMLVVRRS